MRTARQHKPCGGSGVVQRTIRRNSITLRHDRFVAKDLADIEHDDKGKAWTLAYALDVRDKQRLMIELLDLDSDHPQRADLGLPARSHEQILQASYRIFF